MAKKLKLIGEEKLYHLIPGKKKSSRLEASGVALLNDDTALVIFDSLNLIARIDLSLAPGGGNRLIPAPSIAEGFEDIAIDYEEKRVFCIIETMEDTDGKYRGFVSEYDREGRFQRCERLETAFTSPNKGFEGLAFLRRDGEQILYAMCEGNLCTDAKSGGGESRRSFGPRKGAGSGLTKSSFPTARSSRTTPESAIAMVGSRSSRRHPPGSGSEASTRRHGRSWKVRKASTVFHQRAMAMSKA